MAAETIVAISTPPGEGGEGLVRLSGPRAFAIGRRIVRCRVPLGQRTRHVEHGSVVVAGRRIDTALAWALKGPRSFTGEDTVEISCHGSRAVLDAVVAEAVRFGAVVARPGEFTRRAFLSGKMDLVQAEAVIELVRAEGLHGVEAAYGQASGELSRLLRRLRQEVVGVLARLEAELDFPEEDGAAMDAKSVIGDLRAASVLADRLVRTFRGARRRQDGALVVIVGLPNVGKSTLLNALLGEPRAIVAAAPGTTRDLVEGRTVWGGQSVRLVDTAGLRQASDPAEAEGVRRARDVAAQADLVLAVVDGSVGWAGAEGEMVRGLEGERVVVVLNKADLGLEKTAGDAQIGGRACLAVSALSGEGVDGLVGEGLRRLPRIDSVDGVAVMRERHRDALARLSRTLRAAAGLLEQGQPSECAAAEVREGGEILGELLGERVDEAVLDRIFAEFCVGK